MFDINREIERLERCASECSLISDLAAATRDVKTRCLLLSMGRRADDRSPIYGGVSIQDRRKGPGRLPFSTSGFCELELVSSQPGSHVRARSQNQGQPAGATKNARVLTKGTDDVTKGSYLRPVSLSQRRYGIPHSLSRGRAVRRWLFV